MKETCTWWKKSSKGPRRLLKDWGVSSGKVRHRELVLSRQEKKKLRYLSMAEGRGLKKQERDFA